MGRPKDEEYWNQVSKEEDGSLKCKHCGVKFRGGVSRIKAHVDRIEGKGIRICSSPPNPITGNEFDVQIRVNDEIIKSSGLTCYRSYADPVVGFEDQSSNGSTPPADSQASIPKSMW